MANSLLLDREVWKRFQVTSVVFLEDAEPVSMRCFHPGLIEPLPGRASCCPAVPQSHEIPEVIPPGAEELGMPPWGTPSSGCITHHPCALQKSWGRILPDFPVSWLAIHSNK